MLLQGLFDALVDLQATWRHDVNHLRQDIVGPVAFRAMNRVNAPQSDHIRVESIHPRIPGKGTFKVFHVSQLAKNLEIGNRCGLASDKFAAHMLI